MFLIDTNVVSELAKPRPNLRVQHWASVRIDTAFMSTVTVGEIIKGIERLPSGKRRAVLEFWLSALTSRAFKARLLPIDEVVAAEWGRIGAAAGRTLPCADSLLAATARVHDLTIATRNERDFLDLGVRVLNPWSSP
ncbi:MAG: type II toxin-antitoxin system VapC family toxin [Vitreimonas sp.]